MICSVHGDHLRWFRPATLWSDHLEKWPNPRTNAVRRVEPRVSQFLSLEGPSCFKLSQKDSAKVGKPKISAQKKGAVAFVRVRLGVFS